MYVLYIFINCNIIILDGGGGHTVHNEYFEKKNEETNI